MYICHLKFRLLEIIYSKEKLTEFLESKRNGFVNIGFVPTMGALHEGHMSLVQESKKNTDLTVVSIFVNPKQFNNAEDFEKYPNSLDDDLKMLVEHQCDIVFVPSVEDLYGDPNYSPFKMNIDYLGDILEGEKRPGHFDGVVEIVHLLFDIVKPNSVFFGIKDYQQVLVIEKMLSTTQSDIKLFRCPIVREPDGLAISSRNRRLNSSERKKALKIYETLLKIKQSYDNKEDINTTIDYNINQLNQTEDMSVDYIEIADSTSLQHISQWNSTGKNLALIAAFVGKVRLIDNLLF